MNVGAVLAPRRSCGCHVRLLEDFATIWEKAESTQGATKHA